MIVQPGPIVDFLIANQNVRDPYQIDWAKAKRTLKNLRIKASPSNMENKITGLKKWIKAVYRIGLPNVPLAQGDALPQELIWRLLGKEQIQWDKLADSEFGGLWCMEGSIDTWSWSLNVPVLHSRPLDTLTPSMAVLEAENSSPVAYFRLFLR
ncbi:hypothetical protein IFM89_012691 [Coptis chinensis]|uniref:ISE2-like SH3 domain-containing protein n=1 Tax=Coptis chinensis TaxID=261450 RepID=A0A835IVM6_9MAGN|nr:hypothetical protein IFM89_012691 [Coptis chinensis]